LPDKAEYPHEEEYKARPVKLVMDYFVFCINFKYKCIVHTELSEYLYVDTCRNYDKNKYECEYVCLYSWW